MTLHDVGWTRETAPRVGRDFVHAMAARTPTPFEHGLTGHPMLSLDAIAELGEELGPEGISAEKAEKGLLAEVGVEGPELTAIADQIRSLAANDSWFTLLNIEKSPAYADLVDRVLDGIAANGGIDPATMERRMGFVFASSPRSVTSAHFDIEHSFLLQLEGRRTLGIGRFAGRDDREHEVHRYWTGSFGRLESVPEQVQEIELGPGRGAYIPPYVPHWLSNGDETSLSVTVTCFDRSNADESMVQAFNERLRRLGRRPTTYGDSPVRDRAKLVVMRSWAGIKRLRGIEETSASH